MSRTSRVYIQGLPQLVQLKGHNNEVVFREEEDYEIFLEYMKKGIAIANCAIHAWALLPRQLMILVTPQTKEDLSRLIQHIGRCYVPWFNQKYHRSGNLWEGRYNSSLIEPEAYLLITQKYVEIRALTLFSDEGELPPRSSCGHSIGTQPSEIITPHEHYLRLGKTQAERARQYSRFTQSAFSPAIEKRLQDCLNQNRLLGTPQYCQQLERDLHRPVQPRQCGRPRKYYHNQVSDWVWLENQIVRLLSRYCYHEVRLPLLESIAPGSPSDIFTPSGKEFALCENHPSQLRGEGTTGCLQMLNQHPHLQAVSKLWYQGSMFRSAANDDESIEQYQQIGVEAFGYAGGDIELEQWALQYDVFTLLGLKENVELRINTAGTRAEFLSFRSSLRDYFQPFSVLFEPEWRSLLARQPEKLLLSTDPLLVKLRPAAPALSQFLSPASQQRFDRLTESLSKMNIPFAVDTTLFPTNAYCHTHFEWRSARLEEHSLLCRGGRYDDCASEQLARPVQACGFAIMLDPLMQLLRLTDRYLLKQQVTDVVIIPATHKAAAEALCVGQRLRKTFPQLSIANDFSRLRIKTCLRNARHRGGRFIIVVPSAAPLKTVAIVDRESGEEQTVNWNQAISLLSQSLNALPVKSAVKIEPNG